LGKKLGNVTINSIEVPAYTGTKLAATVFEDRAKYDIFISKPAL
jgi:hypothetical protein